MSTALLAPGIATRADRLAFALDQRVRHLIVYHGSLSDALYAAGRFHGSYIYRHGTKAQQSGHDLIRRELQRRMDATIRRAR